jgi:hypothetical protein
MLRTNKAFHITAIGLSVMRVRLLAILMLSMATPVCAQSVATQSGAMSMVNITDPPANPNQNITTHLVTPPGIVAPGLAAAGIETCLGSASGGLSLMGGGFTFGSTKVDEGCTIRLLARQLFAFGFHKAAIALMCQDAHVSVAMNESGTPCPPPPGAAPDEPLTVSPLAYSDPQPAAEPLVHEANVKPFTKEEAALFARATAEE